MSEALTLVSHHLCPYVQRAIISLTEKGVLHDRVYVDLANKPDWFLRLSPLGKTPVLKVGDTAIFESAVILEYLEETQQRPLHPQSPLQRAEHRSWIEFGSAILSDIAAFYNARDNHQLNEKVNSLRSKFARLEERVSGAPWFDGAAFSLVDAAFAPVFRYFDAFERIADFGILPQRGGIPRWRAALSARASAQNAVPEDYPDRLWAFLLKRHSHLTTLMGV